LHGVAWCHITAPCSQMKKKKGHWPSRMFNSLLRIA
jgi:hypothetical protein